jgi:hypothetical protein
MYTLVARCFPLINVRLNIMKDGGIEYEGQWKDDARHGSGTFHLSGLYKYNGSWMDDMRHGQGKCVYADGSVYNGDWKKDERQGLHIVILAENRACGMW